MDKLRAMATFVRIAERGSLTRAARDLATSLPTVVRGLAGLESELGVRLVNRTTRLPEDTGIGLLFIGMLALGVVIISREFADAMLRAYAMDEARSDEIELGAWRHRPWLDRVKEWFFHVIGRAL